MKIESDVLAAIRLATSKRGILVFRNNVGVLRDERNVPVRYGLANDSKALNASVKSSDLIGWMSVRIGPEHVGCKIAQFVSIECKREGWTYRGDDRERAQKKWIDMVNEAGGFGRFVTGEGDL
jgi:hypothetical protein